MVGCENFRCVCEPSPRAWDRLHSKACLVASVMDSVDTDVTELCLALPLWDADEELPVSELNVMGAWKY